MIKRCINKDHDAFEALYQLLVNQALRTAYLITHNKQEAEDAVQETFVQVWRRIGSLREIGSFRSWFYRILVNCSRKSVTKIHKKPILPLDQNQRVKNSTVTTQPEGQLEQLEEMLELRSALNSLQEIYSLPVKLRYYTGLTEAEIAEALSIPIGTVKSRLYTARQSLRAFLSGRMIKRGGNGLW